MSKKEHVDAVAQDTEVKEKAVVNVGQVNDDENYAVAKRNEDVENLAKALSATCKVEVAEEEGQKVIKLSDDVKLEYKFFYNANNKAKEWKLFISKGTAKVGHYKIFNTKKIEKVLKNLKVK